MSELLTTPEAAAYLRLSPRTLENWRVRGGGPRFHKFGDRVLYAHSDLEQWQAESERASTSDPGPLPPPPTTRAALLALPRSQAGRPQGTALPPRRRRGSRAPH